MADEYGAVRSNEFRVKDFDAFKAFVDKLHWSDEGGLILEQLHSGDVIMAWYDQYPSPIPRVFSEDTDEIEEVEIGSDMFVEFASFLEPNSRLFLMAVGNCKLRYTRAEFLLIYPDGTATHTCISSDMHVDAIEAFVNGEM